MSQKETTEVVGRLQGNESPRENLSKLADLARQAYEQKRTKDCLDLTRAILLIDPENVEAQWMRSSIQSEMHRDLENARAFLRQVQLKETSEGLEESTAAHQSDDLADETGNLTPLQIVQPVHSRRRRTRLFLGATVLIVLTVTGANLPKLAPKAAPVESPHPAAVAPIAPNQLVNINDVQPDPFPTRPAEPEPPRVEAPRAGVIPAATPPSPSRTVPLLTDRPVAAPGTLAISSPTSVDIYKDDVYLGSTPVSLSLPAGTQTLEYRHGDMRKSMTHVISSNETTRAMVNFDVTVQINSKPWAEVFLDGAEKKPLGQTPLGGVKVPVGTVLIFENPQFQPKKYRVTGNETGIQIVFP